MLADGVGCPPFPCLGRLITHDDDVDGYDDDGDEDGDHDDVVVMMPPLYCS